MTAVQNLEKLGKELQRSGKSEDIRRLAESEDGRRLGKMLDPKAVESAAKSGDGAALQQLLGNVLSTDEGKRLAEQIKRLMQN